MQNEKPKQNKGIKREFGLSSLSINNRTSVMVMIVMIIIMGISAYQSMPKENFPEINIPTVYVGTTYPGNSPLDIENLITRPIEKEINNLDGINKLTSTSVQDHSTVVVEFNFDVDIQEALLDVKDAVDKAKSELPDDLDRDPNVFELDFAEMPVININISGDDFTQDDKKYYAEQIQDKLENLPEISKAEIRGLQEKEVEIAVDRIQMESRMISFSDIENAIRSENRTMSAGDILVDQFRRSIRIDGEFNTIEDIESIIVKHENQKIVYLRDIADVRFQFKEADSYSRMYGSDVITLEVKKKAGENLLDATDKIKEIIDEERKRLPKNLVIDITNDTSRMTRMNVENLENSIISGVILVVLVLLFFLGLRNAMFVGIAIPLSMLLGFLVLNAAGITLNMMVLFSLILALGMLVDNGIVVVENIYRLMQEGYPPIKAAKEGVGEVAWPIIASTATTLAAFFPLLFWDDIMGEFMQWLPLTLIIVLASSLFVGLVVNPVLTSLFMRVQDLDNITVRHRRILLLSGGLILLSLLSYMFGSILWGNVFMLIAVIILLNIYVLSPLSAGFQKIVLTKIEAFYDRFIRLALKGWMPGFIFLGTVFLMIFSIMTYFATEPKVVTFPENMPNYVNVFVELPTGTDIEKTNEFVFELEEQVRDYVRQFEDVDGVNNIESFLVNVGAGTSDPNSPESLNPNQATPNKARITVSFVEFQKRHFHSDTFTTNHILAGIRDIVGTYPGAKISVAKEAAGPPVGPPISVEISGEDYSTLIALSEKIKKEIDNSGIEGIEELKSDLDIGKPELMVKINRDAAGRLGVSTAQIQMAIRTALFGSEVSKFKQDEDEYDIVIRLNEDNRYNLESLINQKVTFRDQASGRIVQVPIAAVAEVEYSSTFGSVNRKEMKRVITLYSNVLATHNPNQIISELGVLFENYDLPEGYQIKYTGEVEQQQESMGFLLVALGIAAFLILLIIISQFNSLSAPFIIGFSVLLSTTGVFLGLTFTGAPFVVIMHMIGIISLAGVVVNNAIVLIDYTNLVRDRKRMELGMNAEDRLPSDVLREVIVEGGRTRLRPVLLTAITTILGLVPLAVGFNINFSTLLSEFDPQIFIGGDNVVFWGPMSMAIIYGLTFATFLTLIVVPGMYLMLDRMKFWVKSIGK